MFGLGTRCRGATRAGRRTHTSRKRSRSENHGRDSVHSRFVVLHQAHPNRSECAAATRPWILTTFPQCRECAGPSHYLAELKSLWVLRY
jgi:hypothetical protein